MTQHRTMPWMNDQDCNTSIHLSSNEELLQRIQKLELENKTLASQLTASRREIEIAIASKERVDIEYAALLQDHGEKIIEIANFKAKIQWDSNPIPQLQNKVIALEDKLDIRRDEITQLKNENEKLIPQLEEVRTLLHQKTETATQIEGDLNRLRDDLQVYEYFTKIGISLRHRTLEWEHPFHKQNQMLIDEGNKVSHFSTCLADAQLYLSSGRDKPLGEQSHLAILLGERRHDIHIYKTFYGSSPENVQNFGDVEEFVQMLDYRGAMFKFLGRVEYPKSKFAECMKRINGLTRGKGKEELREALQGQQGRQILSEMGNLYTVAAKKHNLDRAEMKKAERQKRFEKNVVSDV